ncbi:asparaginase [Flagelloscypha sp. PMI_526]|nr:asparaginase [Flagelloscypha sp. PMI_526]
MIKKFIAVHGGAGFLSESSEKQVKRALRRACSQALCSPSNDPLELLISSISSLEDDACLNAGYGSNLTLSGTVECDASLMKLSESIGLFGSVGAVSGVKNPIRAAHTILEHSRLDEDVLKRTPPLTLVSNGAVQFCLERGIQMVPPESLVSERSLSSWTLWKTRLQEEETRPEHTETLMQDTVGGVSFTLLPNSTVEIAAGVSSGGILLKYPGRIGEAAVYGAGCFTSESQCSHKLRQVAVSVSGSGEAITRSSLGRTLSEALELSICCTSSALREADHVDDDVHSILETTFQNKFLQHRYQPSDTQAGALVLVVESTKVSDLEPKMEACLWTLVVAPSMSIAWQSNLDPKATVEILRQPYSSDNGPKNPLSTICTRLI